MGLKTFDRGVHTAYCKEQTAGKKIELASLPKTVIIALAQHAGVICEPLVKKGDVVTEGQKIGDVKAFISAPVHASISGKVKEVDLHLSPSGAKVLSVVIDGDGLSKDWGTAALKDAQSLSGEAIRESVRECGIVGMGGAAFPTYVKLAPPKGRAIDTVILNGCECEPYLTADHRVMVEYPEKVVCGLQAIMKATNAKDGVICIEDNKPDAIEALRKVSSTKGVVIAVVASKYPQGAEKMLIKAVLGRKVPVGKLPPDVGVVVNNVGTAVAVCEALTLNKPLIDRVVTISGEVREPKNLLVRIGTSFEEVVAQCGGLKASEARVLNGGPMMGVAQTNLLVPVVKGTSGITVLDQAGSKPLRIDPCIRCARCVEACPMALMPYRLGDQGRMQMLDGFSQWGGFSCIECGCCSYVCPSKRPLLEWIRVAKFKSRKAQKAKSA